MTIPRFKKNTNFFTKSENSELRFIYQIWNVKKAVLAAPTYRNTTGNHLDCMFKELR